MRKLTLALVLAALAVGLIAIPPAQAGEPNAAHRYLYQKNPADWSVVEGGAWGKMRYRPEASLFDFVFNGHNLVARQSYTLLYFPDPFPGSGLICLGVGMADDWGDVHITGKIATGDLPASFDTNYPDGAKIWLALFDDVGCAGEVMTGWHPTDYLFEDRLITFDAKEE